MKEKELFINALETLFWSGPAEAVWAGNDLIEWYEKEYSVTVDNRFTEDLDTIAEQYEKVIAELKGQDEPTHDRVKYKLDKIERIKREYGTESNMYIFVALNEITDILREHFN